MITTVRNFIPMDKMLEVNEGNKKFYERLLQVEKDKNELLKVINNNSPALGPDLYFANRDLQTLGIRLQNIK
jgi:hypothetical protein